MRRAPLVRTTAALQDRPPAVPLRKGLRPRRSFPLRRDRVQLRAGRAEGSPGGDKGPPRRCFQRTYSMISSRAVTGLWSDPRVRSGGIKKLAGRVGPGWEVFELSPVGSGRVGRPDPREVIQPAKRPGDLYDMR